MSKDVPVIKSVEVGTQGRNFPRLQGSKTNALWCRSHLKGLSGSNDRDRAAYDRKEPQDSVRGLDLEVYG